jgi:hypothetical protein
VRQRLSDATGVSSLGVAANITVQESPALLALTLLNLDAVGSQPGLGANRDVSSSPSSWSVYAL